MLACAGNNRLGFTGPVWDGEAEQTMDAINELAVRCGGCDTVCMLSNIMCYCTDEQVRAWHPPLKVALVLRQFPRILWLIITTCQESV